MIPLPIKYKTYEILSNSFSTNALDMYDEISVWCSNNEELKHYIVDNLCTYMNRNIFSRLNLTL